MKPLLKWAGGKRQLLPEIIKHIPESYSCYYEPFIGGGAVLFDIMPKKAVINDLNPELINMYKVVKEQPEELISCLAIHEKKHCEKHYYKIRALDRKDQFLLMDPVERAARTIYLNRTCFNGLFRVNRQGFFNTPMGRYASPTICDSENIREVSEYFNNSRIQMKCGDYAKSFAKARCNDFVYLDPPYDPISATSSFTDYTSQGFNKDSQIRLKEECDKLTNKGVKFLQSNSNTVFIKNLYKDYHIEKVSVSRMINSKSDKRFGAEEVLISNY